MNLGSHLTEAAAIVLTLTLVLATCSLVFFLVLRYLGRSRELLSAERRAAIEKGLEAPLDLALGFPRRFRWNPLKLAILLLGTGVALGLVGLVAGKKPPMLWGLFVVIISLSNLAYYRLGGKEEWERETALHQELYRAHLRRLGGRPAAEPSEGDRP